MSFFGVQLNAQVNRLLLDIRLNLSRNKCFPNLRTIMSSMSKRDSDHTGSITMSAFDAALNENNIFLKKYELQAFQKAFSSPPGINWVYFLAHLRLPLNQYRSKVVEYVFGCLAQGKDSIHFTELMSKFDPAGIQEYKLQLKSKDTIAKELFDLVEVSGEGCVSQKQFTLFYGDLGVNILSDRTFCKFVCSNWNVKEMEYTVVEEQKVKEAIRLFRFKLIQKTKETHQQFILKKVFAEFESQKQGQLTQNDLEAMLVKLEIPIETQYLTPVFQKMDHNNNGTVDFEEFKNFLFFDPFPI